MKDYYSLQEFAEKCNVCENTVRAWIKKGAIDAVHMVKGGRYYINKLNVPTFMREKEKKNA